MAGSTTITRRDLKDRLEYRREFRSATRRLVADGQEKRQRRIAAFAAFPMTKFHVFLRIYCLKMWTNLRLDSYKMVF